MAAWIYELGLLGVILFFYLTYAVMDGTKIRRVEVSFLSLLLFSAIPLNFPLIPLIFALFLVYGKKRIRKISRV